MLPTLFFGRSRIGILSLQVLALRARGSLLDGSNIVHFHAESRMQEMSFVQLNQLLASTEQAEALATLGTDEQITLSRQVAELSRDLTNLIYRTLATVL